jgi:hypothetical protein
MSELVGFCVGNMRRLICYAHFDGKGQVRPFVMHSLQMIRPCCADLVFVSNSPLTDQDQALLAASATHVIVNNNTGYDFYMWKLGLESVDLSLYDEVILMNSSVFGPLFAMEPVFSAMAAVECDFWGITECFQMQPHIQSYFLVFRKVVIVSDAFQRFWNSILPYISKQQVIKSYEVGLTQWFREAGFSPGVFCSFEQIGLYCWLAGKRLRKKDNTSVKYAFELLQAGSPFLKRDAVRNCKVDLDQTLQFLEARGYARYFVEDELGAVSVPCCPICGGNGKTAAKGVRDFYNLHETERYDYLQCQEPACGVLWRMSISVVPIVTVATLPLQVPEALEQQPLLPGDLLRLVRGLLPGGIFVIGVDDGRLQVLESAGWYVGGCLPEKALQDSLNPLSGLLKDKAGAFDCILIAQGFGRVSQPEMLLAACHQLLKTGGRLVLTTANSAAFLRRIFKGYWYGFNAPRNRIIYSLSSLEGLISRSGFKVTKTTYISSNSQHYILHSLESAFNKWIFSRMPRVPLFLNWLPVLCKILNAIRKGSGDECLIIAEK